MTTFDEVLPALARVCESAEGFTSLRACAVVRDLRGRVRLAIDRGTSGAAVDLDALCGRLTSELGDWFVGPIVTTDDKRERGRLAKTVIERAEPWAPKWHDVARGGEIAGRAPWRRLERRLSKDEWLSGSPTQRRALWPLRSDTPGIVTFYSFKGGVGRTTALASCAWQLARQNKRVVAIDLDLEAPGLGALLGTESDRGVLDVVVDTIATGTCSLQNAHGSATALGADAPNVTVLPAGRLGIGFIEKLGRLDFAGADPWESAGTSPVESALEDLLKRVRSELAPDYILIDSRAGLHDLAGLSLHRLAHVDVLVGRATEQSYQGLDLTIAALAKRKTPREMRALIVHTMAPPDPTSTEGKLEAEEFLDRTWSSFTRSVYGSDAPPIARDAPDGQHRPFPVPFDNALTRFATLGGIEPSLFKPGYVAIRERIETLCAPEDGSLR